MCVVGGVSHADVHPHIATLTDPLTHTHTHTHRHTPRDTQRDAAATPTVDGGTTTPARAIPHRSRVCAAT